MKREKDISKKKPKRIKPSVSYVLGLRNQTPRYFSLEWTFAEPVEIKVAVKGPKNPGFIGVNDFVLCSGPYIYLFDAAKKSDEPFSLCRQISVFESTGTFIRGIVSYRDVYLAWGGSYIARITDGNVEQGKTICVKDILSTGRQIISVRAAEGRAEIYYTDGIIEIVHIDKDNTSLIMKLFQRFRLPLEPREKVSCASAQLPQTEISINDENPKTLFLGTSHGRIIVIEPDHPLFVINPEINIPIRQILTVISKTPNAAPAIMILFENGTIVYWYNYQKDKANFVEMKGRFTYLHQSCNSNMFSMMAPKWDYVFAGDRDGHLTILWVSGEILKIARTVKHVASNKITVITDGNLHNLFIGTELGDYHLLELMQFYGLFYDIKIPECVADSRLYYKSPRGWYYLEHNQLLWRPGKVSLGLPMEIGTPHEKKRLQMRYLYSSAEPTREIIAAYNEFGITAQITDKYPIAFNWEMLTETKQRITKVILMKSYILIQYDQQVAELFYIDPPQKNCIAITRYENVKGTITSAECLEDYHLEQNSTVKNLYLLIGYRSGKLTSDIIIWDRNTRTKTLHSSREIDVPNDYIISMITSKKHLGNLQCITLNYNGTASLLSASDFEGVAVYIVYAQQDLKSLIGRGHSLFETSKGILAAGFKQHTLNVCWISMDIIEPSQCSHLFCVDTRSSRLPYSIIEEEELRDKKESDKTKVIVSYYSENGIKETRFPIYKPLSVNGLKNSGIITNSYVNSCYRFSFKEGGSQLEEESEEAKHFVIYTGDTDGRFCVWTLEKENCYVRKFIYYMDFKLTGAVTCIKKVGRSGMILVTTSQGYLYAYRSTRYFQLSPLTPVRMGQKINYFTSYIDQEEFLHILVFLEDGIVDDIVVESDIHIAITKLEADIQKVAQFPVATKMAIHVENEKDRYIAALGVDGILRRTQLPAPENEIFELSWKISVIKNVSIAEMNLLMVGDPQGWVYVTFFSDVDGFSFEIDCYHKHEVVDIASRVTKERDLFIFSLDITGTVIIRKMKNPKKTIEPLQTKFPLIWVSPVPSPRKLMVIPEREIMVVGKGVATKIF